MHLPAGFLDPRIASAAAWAAAVVLAFCLFKFLEALSAALPETMIATSDKIIAKVSGHPSARTKKVISSLMEKHLLKMGAIGALIFAMQMNHFRVLSIGTAAHMIGGIISSLALGPFSAAIVMTVVLFYQSVLFGDGGITVLGANILNMAVIGTFLSYYIYYFIHKTFYNWYGYFTGIALASFSSMMLMSLACCVEIAISTKVPFISLWFAIAPTYANIGLAAAVTSLMILGIMKLLHIELEGKVLKIK